MKNNGKLSEAMFENCLRSTFGAKCYIQRFHDAAHLHGLNGRVVKADKQPADYIVTLAGLTFYAEVKSCQNTTSFSFSAIQANQLAQAKLIRLAGGKYLFFIHNLNTNVFYCVDSLAVDRVGKKRASMRWEEMTPWPEYETYKGKK